MQCDPIAPTSPEGPATRDPEGSCWPRRPSGTPHPRRGRCPPVPVSSGGLGREGCTPARTLRRPRPVRAPGGPQSSSKGPLARGAGCTHSCSRDATMSHTPSRQPTQPGSRLMRRRHRANRTRTCFHLQVTDLENRCLLSGSDLSRNFGALATGGTDVLTSRYNDSQTGANLTETTLTPQNVNASSFGRLWRYTVDGYVYAQPLEVSQVRMGDGQVHNVLIVATENDSVYALDANDPTAGPRHNGVLWQDSFINPAQGITPVPYQDVETIDIVPVLGITSTPVVDRATQTLYVVSKVKVQPTDGGGPHYVAQFHALDLTNGQEKGEGPVTVGDTTLNPDGSFTDTTPISVPGTGAGSADGVVAFNALRQINRPGLVLDTKVPG